MILSFDTDIIIKSKLSIEKFYFCYLLFINKYKTIELYKKECGNCINKDMIISLIRDNYLTYPYEIKNNNPIILKDLKTTSKFNEFVTSDNTIDSLFNKFWDTFPSSTEDGTPLRLEKATCRGLFKDIIKTNPEQIANHIVKCLELEASIRKQKRDLMWMKRTPSWLRGRYWEVYEDKLLNLKPLNEVIKDINSFD